MKAMAKLHLIVSPYSAYGHMIPALMLSHNLVNLGFEVTYVCYEFRLEQMRKHAKARACTPHIKFATLKRSTPSKLGHETGHDNIELVGWSFKHRPEDGEELKELILSGAIRSPSCIITDNLLASWAQDLANELNIPRVVFFPSPVIPLCFEFYVKSLLENGKLPLKTGSDGELLQIPGINSIQLSSNEISGLVLDVYPKDIVDFYVSNALRIHEAAGVLCNTFTRLELEACTALKENRELNPNQVPFLGVGPLLPDFYFNEELQEDVDVVREDYLRWLEEQPSASVVYISFGSFVKPSKDQVEEIAHGILASGKRYLWVLYDGGEKNLPEGFVEKTCTRGKLVGSWVSQLLVLKHRAVGGFLTHCGWNSTMESICQGVPMITMPVYGEQSANAKTIVELLGVGVKLVKGDKGLIHRDALESAFVEVIDNGSNLKDKANVLKEAAREAMEESRRELDGFIRRVICEHGV